MHLITAYITFLLRSTNQHGVHSPFVYGLITRCFYDKKKYASYSTLKKYRKSLLKDKRVIQVKDFGTGSRVFKSDKREVSKMAKSAGISPKRARLLNRLVRYFQIDQALELGTHLGLGTAAMAAGNRVKISTIEGCPETAAVAGEKFEELKLNHIQLEVGKFEDFLEGKGRWTEDGGIQDSRLKIQDSKTEDPELKTGNRSSFAQASKDRELTTDNSQPETGNRKQGKNSNAQIPNSNSTKAENRQPTTHNSQPATGNRKQEKNSKFQIPNSNSTKTGNRSSFAQASKDRELTTDNSQPATGNRQQATQNSELLTQNFDLLFIDGNHQKEATISYFERLLPTIHNDSVMIFDDIHWSRGMEEAWEEIKKHPQVKVTIDTFQWGLVFFRREQEKENFVIRV